MRNKPAAATMSRILSAPPDQLDPNMISQIKNGNGIKFYKSREWRAMRSYILQRARYNCEMCRKEGKYSKAQHVHHIQHLKAAPRLALKPYNLIALCKNCHNKQHPEKLANHNKAADNSDATRFKEWY